MPQRVLHQFVLLTAVFGLVGCDAPAPPAPTVNAENAELPRTTSGPSEKPVPPLQLALPPALPGRLDNKDLKTMEAGELLARANRAMGNEDYTAAATFQYWYVQKSKTGQYNLACFLAQTGQIDPAFYWLQAAAIEEGVDTQHAQRDTDLDALRRDPRWGKVRQYLEDCNRYFESAPLSHTSLIIPGKYQKGTPIAAVVWLHGLGSRPEDFVNESCQDYADELNVAFIGVSGTNARGPRSFVWAEDPEKDTQRLHDALAEVSDRVTIKSGHVITFGFSQGAQVGLEVAVRNPEVYAGSIVLSPGAQYRLDGATAAPSLAQRGFVVSCGAKEHPGNVLLTTRDVEWLRRAGAQVIHKPYPGVSAHTFPKDFDQRFPEWVTFILKARGG